MFCCSQSALLQQSKSFVYYTTWSIVKKCGPKSSSNTGLSNQITKSKPSKKSKAKIPSLFPFPFYGHEIEKAKQEEEDIFDAEKIYQRRLPLITPESQSNSNLEFIDRQKKHFASLSPHELQHSMEKFQSVLQVVRGPLGDKIKRTNFLKENTSTPLTVEEIIQRINALLLEYSDYDNIIGYQNYFLQALDYLERYLRPHRATFLRNTKCRKDVLRLYSFIISSLTKGGNYYDNNRGTFVHKRSEEDTLYAMELYQDIKLALFEEEKKKLMKSVTIEQSTSEKLDSIFQKDVNSITREDKAFLEKQYLLHNYCENNDSVSPLHRIVQSIATSYCSLGLPDFALEFIYSVERESSGVCTCNIEIYDTILLSYYKEHRMEEAEELFEKLKTEKTDQLHECTFEHMALFYARYGHKSKVLEIIQDMKKCNMTPSTSVFKDVIITYANDGAFETIIELIVRLSDLGSKDRIREQLFLTVLKHFASSKESSQSVYSFVNMAVQIGIKLGPEAFDYLVELHSNNGSVEESISLFESMKQNGVNPTIQNYNTLIHGLCRNGKQVEALHYFYQMVYESHWKPQSQTIAIAVSCFSTPEEAVELINTFSREPWSISMTTAILNSLLKLYCKNNRIKEANILVKQIQQTYGIHFDVETIRTLITHLVLQEEDLETAEQWFQQAFGDCMYLNDQVVRIAPSVDERNRESVFPDLDIFTVLYTGYAFEAKLDKMEYTEKRRAAYRVSHIPVSKMYFEKVKNFVIQHLRNRHQLHLSIPSENQSFFETYSKQQEDSNSEDDSLLVDRHKNNNASFDEDTYNYYVKLFEQIKEELDSSLDHDYKIRYKNKKQTNERQNK